MGRGSSYSWVRACTSLTDHGQSLVCSQPGGNDGEGIGNVVSDASGVGSRVVNIEVLVEIEDEAIGGSVWVSYAEEGSGGSTAHELTGTGKVGAGNQDHLARCTSLSDGGDDSLAGSGPSGNIQLMWLVDDLEDHLGLLGVVGGELGPDISELSVGWATLGLGDDGSVPSGEVVDVNDTVCTSVKAGCDEGVELGELVGIKLATQLVVEEELP
jgi:hypothetical protein